MLRAISSLNPFIIQSNKEACHQNFTLALKILFEKNIINSEVAEKAKSQYFDFTQEENFEFSLVNTRLDDFFRIKLTGKHEFNELRTVIKILLIFFHGNAFVESGFSINKNVLVENMQEQSMISQRLILDQIKKCGGLPNIELSKSLINYCRNASRKYKQYLEDKKKTENLEQKQKAEKRKLEEHIKELQTKKLKLSNEHSIELDSLNQKIKQLKKNFKFLYFFVLVCMFFFHIVFTD